MTTAAVRLSFLVVAVLCFAAPAVAPAAPQQQFSFGLPDLVGRGGAQEHEGGEEVEHANEIGILVAGTYEDHDTELTVGFEYERRLHHRFGVAGVVERLTERDAWLYSVIGKLYVWEGLKVLGGVGVERGHENLPLVRVGVAYVFETAERLSIGPFVDVDFFRRETAVVFGMLLGVPF